jgi:hypothetical protein
VRVCERTVAQTRTIVMLARALLEPRALAASRRWYQHEFACDRLLVRAVVCTRVSAMVTALQVCAPSNVAVDELCLRMVRVCMCEAA